MLHVENGLHEEARERMKRALILLAVLVLLGLLGSVGWIVAGLPPPGMVLRYGFTPACAPTGRERTIEGVEFVEIAAGCFRMGLTENILAWRWSAGLERPVGREGAEMRC